MIYSIKSIAMSINKSGGYSDYNKKFPSPKIMKTLDLKEYINTEREEEEGVGEI